MYKYIFIALLFFFCQSCNSSSQINGAEHSRIIDSMNTAFDLKKAKEETNGLINQENDRLRSTQYNSSNNSNTSNNSNSNNSNGGYNSNFNNSSSSSTTTNPYNDGSTYDMRISIGAQENAYAYSKKAFYQTYNELMSGIDGAEYRHGKVRTAIVEGYEDTKQEMRDFASKYRNEFDRYPELKTRYMKLAQDWNDLYITAMQN